MQGSRVLVLCVAIGFLGAAVAGAQGRGPQGRTQGQGAAQRPAKVATHAPKGSARPPTIAANIAQSPRLEARLKTMLPSGMTLEQASEGFRNQGQFIAALEASKNQNIEFARLKAEMTGENALGLGQAIQKLKPQTTTAQ